MRIIRHNGMGDIIMAIPWIAPSWATHELTIETNFINIKWLEWLFPGIKIEHCSCDPYHDMRRSIPGFDVVVNLNMMEGLDMIRTGMGLLPINQQDTYTVLFYHAGVNPPVEGLSPGDMAKEKSRGDGPALVFFRATTPSRCVSARVADMVGEILSEMSIPHYINPDYSGRLSMMDNISKARMVIGGDSGAIHAAEMFGVPWLCLNTTFDRESRHKYYKRGLDLQAKKECSPCYGHHGNCQELGCVDAFDRNDIRENIERLLKT
jgi:hypothetical protein